MNRIGGLTVGAVNAIVVAYLIYANGGAPIEIIYATAAVTLGSIGGLVVGLWLQERLEPAVA